MSAQLVLENLSEEDQVDIQKDCQDSDTSRIAAVVRSILATLPTGDSSKIQVVITANFTKSVSSRQSTGRMFDMKRGSGVVAGKTMPPNKDGVVDILLPLQFVLLGDIEDVKHIGIHEAVHAQLHLSGTQPFDVHVREKFGPAMTDFVAMAGEQIEEHLAEQISSSISARKNWTDPKDMSSALTAFDDALTTQLPAIPQDANYFAQGMHVTFSAYNVLWKALAFLAAELRTGDVFSDVPNTITALSLWKNSVEPYWAGYLNIIGEVPMTMDVDVQKTDMIVKRLAEYLQQWSMDQGFDYHDTPDGQGYFQITNPDIIRVLS
jgi:hypothetical protein